MASRSSNSNSKTSLSLFCRDFSLAAVEVLPSPLSGARRIVDAILFYTNRNTDFAEKVFVRVDVTEEFPILVTMRSSFTTDNYGSTRRQL
jgi:PatG C-terminal